MQTVQLYSPFSNAGLDDLFRGLCKPVQVARDSAVAIKVDVTETAHAYVVHAEVPGVNRHDIQVTIESNQVTIAAETRRTIDASPADASDSAKDGGTDGGKNTGRVLRSERYRGALYRSLVLPVELDEDASTAKYENGVLELTLAKKAAVAGRKLTIQ